jgi:hypothetical protein
MAGYTRQDSTNQIANGKVIDADVFDSEYNAIESGFNATTGHSHDGSAGEGAPITVVGPSQDVIVSSTQVLPKTTNTLDLGSDAAKFKSAWFDGTVNTDVLTVDETATITGVLTASSGVVGDVTGNASTATAWETSRSLTLSGDVTGTVSGIDGTGNIAVTTTVAKDSHTHTAAYITDLTEAAQDIVGAMLSGNTESGIAVTYDDTLGKINFDVNDPVITLSGDVAGSATMTNLGDVSISTTIQANSVALGTDTTGNYVASLVAGTGVTLANNSGETATPTISIGQAVSTTSDVTFNDVVVSGNLTVSGTTTTVNTETINLADNIIVLNSNEAGTPSQNGGIEIERGTSTNKSLVWDEANDRWTVGSETFVASTFLGNLTGNVTGNVTGALTGNASTASTLQTARTITLSGDVSGSTSFNGGSNVTITATVADDSHNHTISNIDGLQTTLDGKAALAGSGSQSFSASTLNATTVDLGDWTITESAGVLYFANGGTNKMKLDASGNLTVVGDVTAYGTI